MGGLEEEIVKGVGYGVGSVVILARYSLGLVGIGVGSGGRTVAVIVYGSGLVNDLHFVGVLGR